MTKQTYKMTVTKLCGEEEAVNDPWNKEATNNEEAWDAYLRVLDSLQCLPGWLALTHAHDKFMAGETVWLNGCELSHIA